MKKGMIIGLSIVAVVAVIVISIVGWLIGLYNGLLTSRAAVDNQWAQVETQYQRRVDLIPNLVNSVQGLMEQEQKVFGDLAEARSKYAGASNVNDKAAAAGQLEGALSRLLVIMENYPQLKSSEAVQSLMAELAGTENRVAVERKRYNDSVKNYNLMIAVFPNNLMAGAFGFTGRNYFESQDGAENAPTVDFDI
ncbi:MAG: LemA family protein [Parcubacteria group bacterium ADurb.Bin326]|nr:MAG: LemA family protein [Parcubacteria group bacterium ADurb.Bin326]